MGDGRGAIENASGALRMAWALATPFLRGQRVRWGATPEEWERSFPGDELVPRPRWQYLHAVTVEAPASAIWPWIVQIGQGRAGFYSYELLENLAGCEVRNADRILPEHQELEAGDDIRLHPKAPPLKVAAVAPGHALVLHGASDLRTGESFDLTGPPPERYMNVSWTFVVEDAGPGRSRLYSRDRADYRGGLGMEIAYGPALIEPISFAMDTKMLQGIKLRAERAGLPRRS